MENFNWEEFKGRISKIAVHCDTVEKANDFLEQANQHGLTWCSGDPIVFGENYYHYFKYNTCYHFVYLKGIFDADDGLENCDLDTYTHEGCEIVEWEIDSPKKFFYVASQCAEERCGGVVELTEAEHKAVRNFLDQMDIFCDGYCGSCGIEDRKFDTKKEAEDTLRRFL